VFSGQLLLELTAKGMRREDAYTIVQAHAMDAWKTEGDFRARIAADPAVRGVMSEKDIDEVFRLERYLVARTFWREQKEQLSLEYHPFGLWRSRPFSGQTINVDTAGIRRKGKTLEMAEKLSVVMARKSLERADVAIVLLDAEQGIAALDAAIAGYASEAGCSIIVALNKWDLLEDKDTHTGAAFERKVREQMKFLAWAPVVTISALVGQRVPKLLPLAIRANEARSRRIPTSQLNQFYERMIERSGIVPAGSHGRSRLHVQYVTQTSVRPPTFVVFTSGGKGGLHFSFLRHLENRLREEFDFFGTPIRFVERHKKKRLR
jgi:small GTP-binding protein